MLSKLTPKLVADVVAYGDPHGQSLRVGQDGCEITFAALTQLGRLIARFTTDVPGDRLLCDSTFETYLERPQIPAAIFVCNDFMLWHAFPSVCVTLHDAGYGTLRMFTDLDLKKAPDNLVFDLCHSHIRRFIMEVEFFQYWAESQPRYWHAK